LTQRKQILAAFFSLLIAATASAQAWRGKGRIQGIVVDPSGKAIVGAKVHVVSARGGGPADVKTDKNGRWAAGGLIGGVWNIDIEAEGYEKKAGTAEVSEMNSTPPMKTQLEPVPQQTEVPMPEEATKESISVGGVEISAETAAALDAANTFMKEQKWAEAAAEYEKAIAVLKDNQSLKFALSRAYYGAGQLKKAIAPLTEVYTADSGNITAATLLANMLAEDGQLDAAKKVLDAMPPGSLTDPTAIINIGIVFMNKGQVQDAWGYFDKAVKISPQAPETYYYRALAELQLKKNDAAKTDLKKVVELAPDGPEAKDAKELLDQLK
jgi:Flp pilus assembly protein TadD